MRSIILWVCVIVVALIWMGRRLVGKHGFQDAEPASPPCRDADENVWIRREDRWESVIRLPAWETSLSGEPGLHDLNVFDAMADAASVREKYAPALAFLRERQESMRASMLPALAEKQMEINAVVLQTLQDHPVAAAMMPWMKDAEPQLRKAVTPDDARTLFTLGGVYLYPRRKDGVPYIAFHFESEMDPEHGMGVMMHGDRVVEVELDAAYGPDSADRDGGDTF